jgi:hypothetical protein
MGFLSDRRLAALILGLLALTLAVLTFTAGDFFGPRSSAMRQWWRGDPQTREALIVRQRESCPGAAFVLPADGFIGLLYGDPRGQYSAAKPHLGIDIFSDSDPGVTPVYAAYDGYITREPTWKSTLIQRIPQDPVQPGRQIWLYYTHMADRQGNDFIEASFPPGTNEFFVRQGTLLGYTGDYNGDALRTVWVHLHFSVVLDDGAGNYANELDFENTIDPSPYFGRKVSYDCTAGGECAANTGCRGNGTSS